MVPVDVPAPQTQAAMNHYRATNALQPGPADPMAPLIEQLTNETTDPMEAILQVIRQALADAPDLASFRAWLINGFGDLPTTELQRVMNTAFSLAELAGRYEVRHGR
ncbi:phage portal protein family protein [Paludibacterium denitrificans]|uniref:DUF935 family protein n=1 Tax=Paludibacterium denitrificans TaxID=2675226 RepID=A0A844GBB3_9NEIS|nr:DUF935 family protein [Paludibacterium denitrificans]MTD32528.1 DUF935 family protein [Paludibacterium denitrificans]